MVFRYLCATNFLLTNPYKEMVSYKDLGLVNTREMFRKAMEGKYAIAAFNFNNMEQMQAIVQAAVECKSPVILQVSSGARKYANQTILRYMAQGAVEYAKELGYAIPICLHLDHGDTFELCKSCVDMGFSSVMIDGSHHPYEENVPLENRRRLSRHLDRYLARRQQIPSRAMHPQCRRRSRTAPLALRHPRRDRETYPGLPHRTPRLIERAPRQSCHHQQIRRRPQRRHRYSRRATPPRSHLGRLQNQHRLRRPSCHDRCHQRGICNETRRVRPA